MFYIRIFVFFLLLLNPISNNLFAQTKILSKEEITKLTKQSSEYRKAANFEKSLIIARIALRNAIAINNDSLIATSYNSIALNYYELSENDKAIFNYNKGLLYAEKNSNDKLKDRIYNNLGNIYCFNKKQINTGIDYYNKSLEYSTKRVDSVSIIHTKLNITWAYFDIGHFNEGFSYLEFINKYHPKFGDEETIVPLYMLNGMYYGHVKENKKADSFFLKAIKLGNEGSDKEDLSYTHQEYSKFLFKKTRF